jgi:phosphoribosylaminoimidazolecarboxamide formyltransferase/IMP cyclohydrolase
MNVMEVAKYTKYPEMKTGLVKSLHPAIHAGILAHKYTESDDEFMKEQGLKYIDAVIVNFYALDAKAENEDSTFEMIRQTIDVGGPSMSHNARKAFISTALITDPENYPLLIEELRANGGSISLSTRINLAKKASTMITDYLKSVDRVIQNINIQQLKDGYEISKGDSK